MRCDACGSGDSLFVVVSENSQSETRLCRACALAQGYLSDEGVSASPQLDTIMRQLDKPGETDEICLECGMGQEQLVDSGRLGCPACVQTFRRQYILARKRRGLPMGYAGKMPRGFAVGLAGLAGPETGLEGDAENRQGDCPFPEAREGSQVLADMETAVLAEDFERAAFLRDRLGSVRTGGKPGNVA